MQSMEMVTVGIRGKGCNQWRSMQWALEERDAINGNGHSGY